MERFDDLRRRNRSALDNEPGRGARVVLGWDVARDSFHDRPEPWNKTMQRDDPPAWQSVTTSPGSWTRRNVGSTVLAPSRALGPTALLDDEFDPRRLVTHPVIVLDLARNGLHLVVRVRPERDRNHWIGVEDSSSYVWSKVVLRSLSEPSLGTFLARYSFTGSCPYELFRRALLAPQSLSRC